MDNFLTGFIVDLLGVVSTAGFSPKAMDMACFFTGKLSFSQDLRFLLSESSCLHSVWIVPGYKY